MKLIIFIFLFGIYFLPGSSRVVVIAVCSILWFIVTAIYLLYIYYKKDKEYESSFKEEYCLTIPCNRPPEVVGFLLTASVKKEYLIASIMELIRKKAICVEKSSNQNDYVLVDNKGCRFYLSRAEEYIKKWLLKGIGSGEKVALRAIRKEAKNNSGYFYACYHEWIDLIHLDCARYNFFESKKSIIENTLIYFAMSFLLIIYNALITHYYLVALLMLVITTAFIIYVNTFYRRNKETNREYEEWMAYKRYIKKEDNSIHEFDNDTLDMYAIYSKVLGVDKEFKRVLSKKNKEDKAIFEGNPLLTAIDLGIIDNISKSLSYGVKRSFLAVILFVRNIGSK